MTGRLVVRGTCRRTGVAALLAAAALTSVAGCGPTTPAAAPAEVAESGPDCLADEVLGALGVPPARGGAPRPASVAGTVPRHFRPVLVVECRLPTGRVVPPQRRVAPDPLVPEDHAGTFQEPPGRDTTGPAEPAPVRVQVLEVTSTGDLGPLLAALRRASEPADAEAVCPAVMVPQPQLYLVDAGGAAVRPRWPVTACGLPVDHAATSLAGLREVDRSVLSVPTGP